MTDPALVELARPDGTLPPRSTHRARIRSRFCADAIEIGLRVEEGIAVQVGWQGEACVICRASANALCGALAGQPVEEAEVLAVWLQAALNGAVDGPFRAFACLREHEGRHACATLPHEALQQALEAPPEPPGATATCPAPGADAWSVVQSFREQGLDVAIATLIDAVGSSPCPVGSHMVIAADGSFWGAVSGGCVEANVVRAALAMLGGDRSARILPLQIANSQAGTAGLPCGGQIRVHVAPAPGLRALRRYQSRGEGLARWVDLETGSEHLAPSPLPTPQLQGSTFVEPLTARPQLLLVGGTAVAQHLATLAPTVGFDVTVIEPRPGFTAAGRFSCPVLEAEPEHGLAGRIHGDTAVLVLTHEPVLDDPALHVALRSPAFYVGALGSRRTQRSRLERLERAGLSPAVLQRLHGPAGLPIGAVGPAEIALSMLAQVVAVRRQAGRIRVGGVVLAAGSSRRAGQVNKLLVPIDGVPMVRRVVMNALEAGIGPLVVVLGHQSEAVRAVLDDLPVQLTHNADHADGMGGSIAVGIEALAAHPVTGALVLLGDMPWVRPEDLAKLAGEHTPSTQHLIVAPVAPGGRRGNPVLWPVAAFADLERLRGDVGGRGLIEKAGDAVALVPVEHDGILRDLDVPAAST